jgi:hypothetical protein
MRQIKPNTQQPRKWALALRREMQMAVGLQLQVECEPPQELRPELTAITAATKNMIFTRTSSVRADKPRGGFSSLYVGKHYPGCTSQGAPITPRSCASSYLSSVFVSGGNISTFVITSLTNFASAGNRGNDSNHALHFGQRQT